MDKEIHIFIYKLRRRLGIQKAMNIFPFVLSIGFFIGFLHLFFGYFYPFYYAGMLASFWIVVSILFGIIYFFLHFPKEQEAAHMGDAVIGQERLLTALELRGKEEPISCLQKEDTISHIAICNIKEAFPYQLHFKQLLLFIFMASLFFLFLYLPSNAKLEAEKLHTLKQKVKEELTVLDNAEKEITQEKISEKQASSTLETIGKKLNKDGNLDTIKELLEQTKKEYSSANSKQELQKAKERFRVKLENLAEKQTSLEKQTTISELMKEMGFSAYHNLNNTNESKTTALSENTSAINNTETQNQKETSSSQKENYDSNDSNHTSNNDNNNHDSSNTSNNDNSNDNDNNKNSNKNDNSNHLNDIDSTNNTNHQSSDSDSAANQSENQSGNRKENGSHGNTGKNHGSKKGIERKSKKKETKEKVMVVPDTTSQDKALTGAVSDTGNSHQQSSDQQLSFGKKENLEKVEKEYAKDVLTTIDNNNSIPIGMKDIVQSYFSQMD